MWRNFQKLLELIGEHLKMDILRVHECVKQTGKHFCVALNQELSSRTLHEDNGDNMQVFPSPGNFLDPLKDLFEPEDDKNSTIARFSLRKPSHPDDDLCFIIPGQPESLTACTFNRTSKTFLLIHGWTVSRSK